MSPRPPTAAELYAIHGATFRPAVCNARGIPHTVLDCGSGLLASLDGIPMLGSLRAVAGALYRVRTTRWTLRGTVVDEYHEAVVAVREGRRLVWLAARVRL